MAGIQAGGGFLVTKLASRRVPAARLNVSTPAGEKPPQGAPIRRALGLHGSSRLTALPSPAPGLRGHGAMAPAPWRGQRATVALASRAVRARESRADGGRGSSGQGLPPICLLQTCGMCRYVAVF